MRFVSFLLVLLVVLPAAAQRRRAALPAPRMPAVVIIDDFRDGAGTDGWEAGFSDYSPVHADIVELFAQQNPADGFVLSSHNRSDDLFMFLTKKLTTADRVRPSQRYEVSFHIKLASQVGIGCSGIGGSPGESVYLKVGAWHAKPEVALVDDHYRLTVDHGNQSQNGEAASVAGDITNNSENCSEAAPFLPIERTHRHPNIVQSNATGEIWLLVGTDSAFEGKTTLHYHQIQAALSPAP